MANLFDGIRKIEKEECILLLCHFRVYSYRGLLERISQWLKGLAGALSGKKNKRPFAGSWQEKMDREARLWRAADEEHIRRELCRQVKKCLLRIGRSRSVSEDKISADITRLVWRGYQKEHRGFSVPEMNQWIFENYEGRKKTEEHMLLYACFVSAGVLILCLPASCLAGGWWGCAALVGAVCFFIADSRRRHEKLAHFVYTAFSGIRESTAYSSVTEKNAAHAGALSIYHSLLAREGMSLPPGEREVLSEIIAVRGAIEKDRLKQLWWKQYPNIEFRAGVFQDIIDKFAYADLTCIEKRIFELSSVKDPFAIAEKRGAAYEVSFQTAQGDIAVISYAESAHTEKSVCISRIKRARPLRERLLSERELRRLPEAGRQGIAGRYLQYLKECDAEVGEMQRLTQGRGELAAQQREAEALCRQKQQEAALCSKRITALDKESMEIKEKRLRAGMQETEYERLRKIFLDNQAEIAGLEKERAGLENEIKQLLGEIVLRKRNEERCEAEIEEKKAIAEEKRAAFAAMLEKLLIQKQADTKMTDAEYLLERRIYEKVKQSRKQENGNAPE